jgi:hypothetical protein
VLRTGVETEIQGHGARILARPRSFLDLSHMKTGEFKGSAQRQ